MGKKILLFLLGIILLASVPITLFVLNKNQELRQKAAPATTLALSPSQLTKKVGDEFSLDAVIDTGANAIQEVLVEIEYDPTKIKALSLTNSATFPNIIASENITDSGTASIAVGTASVAQPFSGTATAVTIRFQALANTTGAMQVKFTQKAFVGSVAEGQVNSLIGATPSLVTISDGSGSTNNPTPTATPASRTTTPTPALRAGTPTPTLRITPTPTTVATSSGTLSIITPRDNDVVSSAEPSITGNASPGSTVTITLYPGSVTAAVTADTTGNWTYTPTSALADGAYTLTATSSDATTGAAQNVSIVFAVGAGVTPTTQATDSSIPVTGAIDTTITMVILGGILVLAGLLIPVLTL